jgi:hypothetical protein
MQKLNNNNLQSFIDEPGVSVVMFGAPTGEATMNQALAFAEAWLDCHDDANFGYIDAFDDVAAARTYRVRVLPTTMVAKNGQVVAWIEGNCSRARVSEMIACANAIRERIAA